MTTQATRAARRIAFTLMEVLVVVAILVILAGGAFVIVTKYLDDAKVDRAKMDIKNLEKVVDTYKLKHGEFPASLDVLAQAQDGGTAYIEASGLVDPWGNPYQLDTANLNPTSQRPQISSNGPRLNDPTSRITNW